MTKSQLLTLRRVLHSHHTTAEHKRIARTLLDDSLSTVQDVVLRKTLTLYLVHGYTWQRVAMEMGWKDEASPRKLAEKFWKNNL